MVYSKGGNMEDDTKVGRPIQGTEKTETTGISIEPRLKAAAKAIGHGNISRGACWALKYLIYHNAKARKLCGWTKAQAKEPGGYE
jgi:hypothetical protein